MHFENKQSGVSQPVDVVVMAAGKGTRMKSALPKVLHRIGGRPLLQHVLDTAASLPGKRVWSAPCCTTRLSMPYRRQI